MTMKTHDIRCFLIIKRQWYKKYGILQGWEIAHRISERIARFLPKNEQFAHDRSFPLSNLSKSLMVAHFC